MKENKFCEFGGFFVAVGVMIIVVSVLLSEFFNISVWLSYSLALGLAIIAFGIFLTMIDLELLKISIRR